MGTWIAVGLILTAALVVVLVALFHAAPMARRAPARPDWLVPTPGELRELRFPLALQGYDPDTVDAAYSAVVDAYEELYLAAGPAAIARAQERLEQRRLDSGGATATGLDAPGPTAADAPAGQVSDEPAERR